MFSLKKITDHNQPEFYNRPDDHDHSDDNLDVP